MPRFTYEELQVYVHPSPAPFPGGRGKPEKYRMLSFFFSPLAIPNEPKLSKKLP
jgi:hypothetical protein